MIALLFASIWFDEVEYWNQLAQKRPDLVAEACYDSLAIKPKFRDGLLSGQGTPAQIRSHYSGVEQAADLAWLHAQQSALVTKGEERLQELADAGVDVAGVGASDPSNTKFRRLMGKGINSEVFDYAPSGYAIDQFVGYETMSGAIADSRGLDFKVFFEFKNARRELTPSLLAKFSEALASAGFQGDLKTTTNPRAPWVNRFQYNNIIVHAHSIADAQIAEQIGLSMFAGKLVHMSRGMDVMKRANGTNIVGGPDSYNWHSFLCTGMFNLLPDDARAFALGQ